MLFMRFWWVYGDRKKNIWPCRHTKELDGFEFYFSSITFVSMLFDNRWTTHIRSIIWNVIATVALYLDVLAISVLTELDSICCYYCSIHSGWIQFHVIFLLHFIENVVFNKKTIIKNMVDGKSTCKHWFAFLLEFFMYIPKIMKRIEKRSLFLGSRFLGNPKKWTCYGSNIVNFIWYFVNFNFQCD